MSILAMLTGLILALAMVLGMAGEAYAASLRPSEQNLHIRFTHGISLPLGVIGLDTSNNHYYCMEAGPITDYTVGPVRLLKDDQNARRMAWILEQYRKAGMKDVEIQLYSGDRHEILNEKDRKRVFEKIADWMAKRE